MEVATSEAIASAIEISEQDRVRASSASHEHVPGTLAEALRVFATHPSTVVAVLAVSAMGVLRAQAAFGWVDAVVGAAVWGLWVVQEWVIHRKLLHSNFNWFGRDLHEGHHHKPYYHISIDPPSLVLGAQALSLVVFGAAFGFGSPLGLTAAITYSLAGINYEFCHYIVHTRYVPRSKLLRQIRSNHMLHHCRNEDYWLSFSLPAVDNMFGTNPRPSAVKMSALAKQAHGYGRMQS